MDWQLILTACAVAALVIMLIETVVGALRRERERKRDCHICQGSGRRVIIGRSGYRSVKCDHRRTP